MRQVIKTFFIMLFAILLASSEKALAQRSSGIGVIIGEPTGISVKLLDRGGPFFNLASGWSLRRETYFYFHADYILQRYRWRVDSGVDFKPYVGIGGRLKTDKTRLGVRVPLGIGYDFREAPFDIFLEIAPTLNLIPSTDFDIGAGLGFRFLF